MDIDNDQLNDMGEYFDFGGASTQAVPDFPAASAPPDAQGFCPSHPGTDRYVLQLPISAVMRFIACHWFE